MSQVESLVFSQELSNAKTGRQPGRVQEGTSSTGKSESHGHGDTE